MSPRPLEGLRVVDLADEKGELTGRLLADLGADVVRVEPHQIVPALVSILASVSESPASGSINSHTYFACARIGSCSLCRDAHCRRKRNERIKRNNGSWKFIIRRMFDN
ncbi:MAG: CoA transferase [Mycoplasmataceae bacterium]|nr:CoA transferase [Mycoplasmataceae bacterium]